MTPGPTTAVDDLLMKLIQNDGELMPTRSALNFVSGVTLTDNPTNDSTDVAVTGGGGGTLAGDVTGPEGSNTVSQLQGTNLSVAGMGAGQDGYVLQYSNYFEHWFAQPLPYILPVTLNLPQPGDVIMWNGSQWVNDPTLTNLVATVTALQAQVTNLSNGQGFSLNRSGGGSAGNVEYDGGSTLSFLTT